MVKKLLAVCALAFLALSANAESNYMTVEKTNGSKISFLLADNPVITYKDGNLVINKDAKTTYSFEDIKNYHFTENDDTKATSVSAEALRIVWIDDATVEVRNAQSGSVIALTAINGTVVATSKADADGNATVKMPYNAGVYVLSAGNQSFKIIRK